MAKKSRHKMTTEKRAEMFSAWCEKKAVKHVATRCNVHYNTARRYRDIDDWEARSIKLEQKTSEAVVQRHVNANVKTVNILDAAINVFAASLVGTQTVQCPHCQKDHRVRIPKPRITAGEFERLVNMRNALTGDNKKDERTLVINHVHIDKAQYDEKQEEKTVD